jgi:hypothetical protein
VIVATLRPSFAPFDLPVRAADRVRIWWLRSLGPLGRILVRDREARVAVGGAAMVIVALVATLIVPIWMLALAPVVWGVPHILSDVRYLFVRPGLHRRWPLGILMGVPFLVLSYTLNPAWGFGGAAGAALCARASWTRRIAVAVALLALASVVNQQAFLAAVIFAHVHNFVGVALWWVWRPRKRWVHLLPIALFAIGFVLILAGAFDAVPTALGSLFGTVGDMDYFFHLSVLAPGMYGPIGARLILSFLFAQTVHYGIWVRMIPDEDRAQSTTRTFRATLRALSADVGWPWVALTVLAILALAAWAAFDLFAARTGYLRFAQFHGYLEVAAIAILVAEGIRPKRASARAT